tara:strand:- start:1774 stop:5289 length:3516 start_codon:yes stop_codon:yes gene_type:complete
MSSYLDAIQEKLNNEAPRSYLDDIQDKLTEENDNRDPIDKVNQNLKLNESLAYYEKKEAEEPTVVGETAKAFFGGIRDAAQGVLNLEDTITDYFTKKVPYDVNFSDGVPTIKRMTDEEVEIETSDNPFILPEVDKNETIAGQIGRDLTRFIAGTFLARGSRLAVAKKVKPLKGFKVSKDDKGFKKLGKKTTNFLLNVGDSVVGSQLVSAGDEGRLSDILAQIPELTEVPGVNDAIDALKSNPKDTEAQSRLKMAIEDAVVAFPIEIGVKAAKLLFKGSKDPIRKAFSKETVDSAEDAINAKKASDETVDLLENTGNSKALLPNPLFDEMNIATANLKIKFKNKDGKELFETVNDGVEDMVNTIFKSNEEKKRLAKATGTRAPQPKTVERAKKLGLGEDNFESFFKQAGIGTTPEYVTAARMLFIGSADKVQSIAKLIASGEGGAQAQGQLAKAVLRHRAIQEKLLGLKANAGRTLNAFNIPVGNNSSIRNKQISELTAAVLGGDIGKISKAAQDLATNTDEALGKLMKDKFTDTKTDKLNQFIYFNYLSSPSTYLVNTVGNAFTQLYETLVATPTAAVVGAIRSPFLKAPKDRVYFSEVAGRTMGTAHSMLEASKNFLRVLRDGDLPPELKRMSRSEYEEIVGVGAQEGAGIGRRIVGGVIRFPGKILLATDALFKTMGKSAFIYQQAYRGAAQKGLTPGTRAHGEFVSKIINKTPAQLEKAALEDAARITFTKDNKIASSVAKIKRVPVLGNITATYLPFVRTPLNLAGYSINNSFFGVANPAVVRAIAKGGAEADEAIGRILAGSGVIAGGTILASQGVITGTGDGYRQDVVKTQGLGFQDKAIRIGDKTYSFNRFDPFATPIGFGADIYAIYKRMGAIKDTDQYADLERYLKTAIAMTGASLWANVADKAMLTGIAQLSKDIEQFTKVIEGGTDTYEYALNKFAQQAARAVTPNVLRMYGRASDPFVRDTYTALDVIKDAMPFLRHNLPIRHDMFGRIMYLEQYGDKGLPNDVLEVVGSISRVYSIKDDPLAKELIKMEYAHSRPSRKMNITGFEGTRVELDLKQYAMLEGYTGAHFHQLGLELIQTREYKKALPPEKKTMIEQIKRAANAFGKEMVLQSHGIEIYKKARLNYFEDRRLTPYWDNLPEHMRKTYKNQQPLPKNIGKDN